MDVAQPCNEPLPHCPCPAHGLEAEQEHMCVCVCVCVRERERERARERDAWGGGVGSDVSRLEGGGRQSLTHGGGVLAILKSKQ